MPFASHAKQATQALCAENARQQRRQKQLHHGDLSHVTTLATALFKPGHTFENICIRDHQTWRKTHHVRNPPSAQINPRSALANRKSRERPLNFSLSAAPNNMPCPRTALNTSYLALIFALVPDGITALLCVTTSLKHFRGVLMVSQRSFSNSASPADCRRRSNHEYRLLNGRQSQ